MERSTSLLSVIRAFASYSVPCGLLDAAMTLVEAEACSSPSANHRGPRPLAGANRISYRQSIFFERNVMKAVSSVLLHGLLAVLLGPSARLLAAERMTPGQWELTTTTKGETQVFKFCADALTLAIANGDARSGREALVKLHTKTRCTVAALKAEGSTVSYTLTCPDRTVRITETYHGDRYEGVLKTKKASEVITADYTARRLGACP
jgi:hypothetical protein